MAGKAQWFLNLLKIFCSKGFSSHYIVLVFKLSQR